MSRTILASSIIGVLVAAIAGYILLRPAATVPLVIPDLAPRAGESTPSPEFLKAQATIARYRFEAQKHPSVVKNYIELAQVYLQEGRVTGKHHFYMPIADRMLDEAFKYEPKNFDASILRASMLMTKHQFANARTMAEQAIASNPYNAFAYGVLCDAHVELGDYDQAIKDCDKMMSTRPDLRSYARASYLREIHGDRNGAAAAMKLAADAGQFGDENREWALYTLANLYFGMGKLDTAEYIYKGILEERPSYAFAMSGLGMVALAKGKAADAIEWLVKATQISPEHIFVEQLADIYHMTGDKQAEAAMEHTALTAFRVHEAGGWDVDRELAIFFMDHDRDLPEALTRAKREYDRRPANIDALDTYAWALYRNSDARDALPIIRSALRFHTENGLVHYHAAAIYSTLGLKPEAASEIKTTFDESPFLTNLSLVSLAPARQLRDSLAQLASIQ